MATAVDQLNTEGRVEGVRIGVWSLVCSMAAVTAEALCCVAAGNSGGVERCLRVLRRWRLEEQEGDE